MGCSRKSRRRRAARPPVIASLPMMFLIAVTFFLAGIVKGVTGMGLPTVAMGVLELLCRRSEALDHGAGYSHRYSAFRKVVDHGGKCAHQDRSVTTTVGGRSRAAK